MNNLGKIVDKVFENNLPHRRTYAHSLGRSGKDINESFYSNDELNALRQAIVNHEAALRDPNMSRYVGIVRDYINKENKQNDTPILKRYMERTIDYPDYKQVYALDDYGGRTPVNFNDVNYDQYARLVNEKNPNFFMQGSIGAADYSIDDKGNVTLTDKYDFTQDKDFGSHYSPAAYVAKTFGKPYNINLNLGNINDWGMKQSGTNNIVEMARALERGETGGYNNPLGRYIWQANSNE